MILIKVGNNAAINPALVASAQYHTEKGVMVMGANNKPLAYVEEIDPVKGQEILEPLTKAILKADKKHRMIGLKDNGVISVELIASVTTNGNIFIINDKNGDAVVWLTTSSDEEAMKVAEEVLKAVNSAGKGNRYVIKWDELMPAS